MALETESGANTKGSPQTKPRPRIRDKTRTLRKAERQSPPYYAQCTKDQKGRHPEALARGKLSRK